MARLGIDVRLTYYRKGGIAEYMRQLVAALGDLTSYLSPLSEIYTLHNYRAKETLAPDERFKRVNCYTPCHHRFEATALGLELLPRRLDLLHSPDFIPPKFGAKRYVITVHDLAFLLFKDLQTAESLRYYAGQIQRAVTQADHIIAVSESTKSDLIELLNVPPEKISVTWEGVHPDFRVMDHTEAAEKLKSYPLQKDYLLFVGTIEPRKNIPNLLKGYAIAKERLPDLSSLVLVGEKGWLSEASFRAVQELNLQKDVVWLGGVPFNVLPALYNGAKLHLYPSLYEGFGFPALEAMACGTPTIVSNRGALAEVAGDAATFVDPDQPEAIAEAIEKLLNDSALAEQMRERGLAHVRQFTWQATAEKTLEVYKRVLA